MRRLLLWFLTTVSTVAPLFGCRTSTSSALPTGETGTGDTAAIASSPGSTTGSSSTPGRSPI